MLDLHCNVGGGAIAGVKRGNLWVGVEPDPTLHAAVLQHVCTALSFEATTSDYFTAWEKRMYFSTITHLTPTTP